MEPGRAVAAPGGVGGAAAAGAGGAPGAPRAVHVTGRGGRAGAWITTKLKKDQSQKRQAFSSQVNKFTDFALDKEFQPSP